jgi:hypothetical protein
MDTQDFMPDEAVIAGIKADLERYEAERRQAHRAVMWRRPVFIGVALAVIFAIAWFFNGLADPNEQWFSTPHVFLYFFGFFALFFVHSQAMKPATRLQQSLREKILPVIFGFIENLGYRHEATPDSYGRLPQETVGSFNRQSFDDVISGRYEGFPFELYEATLRRKAGKSTSEVFKGVIVAFETITPFPGVLVATRKTGKVVGFFRGIFGSGGLEELHSGVPELDEDYEFRTDNIEAARPLVTGRLAKALQWLGETWPERQARVGLKGSDGFLLIPLSKNFFELPGIAQPLEYKGHVEPMIADMAALLATAALVRKIGAADDDAAAKSA